MLKSNEETLCCCSRNTWQCSREDLAHRIHFDRSEFAAGLPQGAAQSPVSLVKNSGPAAVLTSDAAARRDSALHLLRYNVLLSPSLHLSQHGVDVVIYPEAVLQRSSVPDMVKAIEQ